MKYRQTEHLQYAGLKNVDKKEKYEVRRQAGAEEGEKAGDLIPV